ncbi:MAG TPA: DUF6293 family protein [Candidatus Nanoarchaeia archaeon]|nr:DUF6293 family protein [Candidatus Nanoarchaeia archaeon]
MKHIVVAPVGDHIDDIFVGIREFPTERVVLIAPPHRKSEAQKAKKGLEKFRIPVSIREIKGNVWEEIFAAVSEIKQLEKGKNVIVNVSTGDRDSRCAATSAAYVNGIKAFAVDGDHAMLLPILKFSYYKTLTDKKMELLRLLNNKDCCASLEQLSKKSRMSLPLISYHINGNLKSEGLKDLGLVETAEEKGRVAIKLSMMGRMLLKGYIHQD